MNEHLWFAQMQAFAAGRRFARLADIHNTLELMERLTGQSYVRDSDRNTLLAAAEEWERARAVYTAART